ncbi:MAG: putative bifunctional diguanylate cyclase/phosphodiesterase [Gammaproteobacteria bacterium]
MKTLAASIAVVIGAASAVLLVVQSLSVGSGDLVIMRYLADPGGQAGADAAARALFPRAVETEPRQGLTPEGVFWMGLEARVPAQTPRVSLELRQLRATEFEFWQVVEPEGGAAPYSLHRLQAFETRSGLAFEHLIPDHETVRILGHLRSVSVVKPQVVVQHASTLDNYLIDSDRLGGLLYGAMLGLAIFGGIVSLLNRDKTFFLLSALLVTSVRVAGFNSGWDLQWIGWAPDPEYVPLIKNATLLLHMVLALALFEELFRKQLKGRYTRRVIGSLYLSYAACFGLTLALSAHGSIALIWALGATTTAWVFVFLARILAEDASPIAIWFALAWVATGLGTIGEITNAVGIWSWLPKIMNSQVAAISSAVLAGIALASKLRLEKAARIAAQHSAITALQRFRENYNAVPVGIFAMALDGTILEHNPTFGVMFPLDGKRSFRTGANWSDLTNPAALKSVKEMASDGRMLDTELLVERSDGPRRWFHMRGARKADRFEAWIEEITSRKEAEGQLRFLVDHDSLTGLLNRRGFEIHVQQAIERACERFICLAYVDLDKFKLINDLFGHAAGDQILRQLSTRMRMAIQPPHVAARVGGDEFVVIIDGLSFEDARELCERLRMELSHRPCQYQDKVFSVTASIGLIQVMHGMQAADALIASDRACSAAKRAGGGAVVAFDSDSSELLDYLDEIKLVAGMKERLPVENFFTQLQPIVSLRDPEASLAYEVLLRMRDKNGQVLPPARFVPAAERNGLMTQIDRWVLRSTLEWLDSQPAHRDLIEFCTLNLSGASLNDEKFLLDTISLIRDHSASTKKICFEITETAAIANLARATELMQKLKALGCRFALDDFGAGHTSFSYLKELPCDLVKIDGHFILDVDSNPANLAITRAVVQLVHELGMTCVAEWVEHAGIVRCLLQLEVDYVQGFGLSRPLDRERLLSVGNAMMLIEDHETADLMLARSEACHGLAAAPDRRKAFGGGTTAFPGPAGRR